MKSNIAAAGIWSISEIICIKKGCLVDSPQKEKV